MDCTTARKSLTALEAGDLTGEDARRLRLHLAACKACRFGMDDGAIPELLPALDECIEPSADLGARFHERLMRHRAGRADSGVSAVPRLEGLRRWIMARRLSLAALTAGVVICAIIAGTYLRRGSQGEAIPAEQAIAENLPLLEDLQVISHLELLEEFEDIEKLSPESSLVH